MIVLVTGISGFLGSHLATTLVEQGHDLISLKRATSDLSRLGAAGSHIRFIDVDLRTLSDELTRCPVPDAIVHLATCYGRHGESGAQVVETNTLFPLRVLEWAAARGVRTFIAADTCINTWPIRYPYLSSYMLSKRHFAQWGEIHAQPGRLHFVNVKLHHPYGPEDRADKFVPQLIRDCLEQTGDIALTHGEQKKDFVYVDDVTQAFVTLLRAAASLPSAYTELECGSGVAISIREFATAVHRLTGSRARLAFGAVPSRDGELALTQADVAPLRSLGWSPRVTLEEGIREILRRDYGRA